MPTPTITLEDHYTSQAIGKDELAGMLLENFPQTTRDALFDMSDARIEAMDKNNVSLQVISHSPGSSSQNLSLVSKANDELYRAIKGNSRYAAFAALPMCKPESAAQELKRCTQDLGFLGAMLDNHLLTGEYYDDKVYWPVFQAAEELDVPIYLHPTFPVDTVKTALYNGDWSEAVANSLGTSSWGWHSDVGLHILRLHVAGVFDAFPKLKIVIGHMGEMIPFMLDRIHQRSSAWKDRVKRTFLEVYKENIWITTASFFSLDPLACILRNTKPDHIMFSIDYPFSSNEQGRVFLEELQNSDLVTRNVFEGIAYKNAEKLLKIKAKR